MKYFIVRVDIAQEKSAVPFIGRHLLLSEEELFPRSKFYFEKTVHFYIGGQLEAFGSMVAECDASGCCNVTLDPEVQTSTTDPGCEDRARCSAVAASPGPARGGGAAPPHCPGCENRARCSAVAASPGPARGGAAPPHCLGCEDRARCSGVAASPGPARGGAASPHCTGCERLAPQSVAQASASGCSEEGCGHGSCRPRQGNLPGLAWPITGTHAEPPRPQTSSGYEDRARCSGVAGSPGPARGVGAPPHCPSGEVRTRFSGVAGSPGPARGVAASPHWPSGEDRARCSVVVGSPGSARGVAASPHWPSGEDRARCSGVAGSPGPARGVGAPPHCSGFERLAPQIIRLNQIIEEIQSNIENTMNAMGLQRIPFNSNHSVREEAAATEPTLRCNPALPSTSSVAQNRHDDPSIRANDAISRNKINTLLTRNGSSNVVLSEMNKNQFQNRRPTTTSQEERTTERANSSDSDADNEVPADMIPIGSGKTLIPRHVYAHIDWTSYTKATRKLLMAVFPRRTLATHSLTGKASPAFTSKPAKLQLDIKKVSDIVMSVVENCRVREGHVRSCITTKCADENKMYNMRQKKKANKKKAGEEMDGENSPPLRARGTEHGARQ